MLALYQRWMHDWEARLTERDANRVVRPLGWLGLIAVPLWFAWRARQSRFVFLSRAGTT